MIDSGTFFVVLFFGVVLLTFSIVVFLHILHFILTKKYDAVLFKEPIFNKTELIIMRIWPYSLMRTLGYILLLALSKNSRVAKKRFKGVEIDRSNVFLLTLFSRVFLFMLVLTLLFFLIMILWAIYPSLWGLVTFPP